MILDEVQRGPPIILAIKVAVDQQRPQKRGQFVLTGSANLLMMKHVSDSLAGRATDTVTDRIYRRQHLTRELAALFEHQGGIFQGQGEWAGAMR